MAQNVTINGVAYSDVPAIEIPKTGGGNAEFVDTTDANAVAGDISVGKTAYVNGVKVTGTGSGGGGGAYDITSTENEDGTQSLAIVDAQGGGATEPYIEETYDSNGNLTNAVLHGYTQIRNYMFYACRNLVSPTLPDGITSIGTSAFSDCTNLTLTSLPGGLTSIGGSSFYGCTNLALTSLPSGLQEISNYAFQRCASLDLEVLPSTINSVGNTVFQYCTSLTNMEIGCTTLGWSSFERCTGLEKVWFRNTCTTVSAGATTSAPFVSCSTSLQIYCEADSKPSGYGTYFNRTGTNGNTIVTVVYGQTTRPW